MDLEPIQTGVLGVNTWIVPLSGPAVMIVDPAACQVSGDENVIIDYLEENKLTPVAVLLTHGHFDHVQGLPVLKKKWPDLSIVIHKDDSRCIGADSAAMQERFLRPMGAGMYALIGSVSNLPEPTALLEDGITLDKVIDSKILIDEISENDAAPDVEAVEHALSQWQVIHTPGHTPGCVCFYNESESVLISGDTMFAGSYGRTDLYGGDDVTIKKSLCRLVEELPRDTLVYPGHGEYGFSLGENYI